jgi:nicotinamide riboside transporter PnuC
MIPVYQKRMSTAGVVCIAAVVGALALGLLFDSKQSAAATLVGALLSMIAGSAFIYAAWCYIKAKGRSGWWILVLVFNLLGILILALLKDQTANQTKKAA